MCGAHHFANIYGDLYSKVELGDKFENLRNSINDDITEDSLKDVNRVNNDLIKQALAKMKDGKSDVLFDFTSDLLMNGPPELTIHIVNMFRGIIIHGSVPFYLLICTLVPIVKDSLGNHAASDNYRAIAISSLFLKLFDWCILLLEGDKLHLETKLIIT